MSAVAAIDCGTNSIRLLVSDGERPLERLMTITRLGQGVGATERLAPEAIERTADALRRYADVIGVHDVRQVRMTATSAARDAANRDDFFDIAEQIVGVRPELITGEEEARLSFRGAVSELEPGEGPFLVVDIGGGSTEIAYGDTEPSVAVSVDVGCVRLTEKFLVHDPPLPEELTNALWAVRDELEEVVRDHPEIAGAKKLVGLAGTVTTMAAVEIGLAEYDRDKIHHLVLTRAAAEDVFRTLATEPREDRAHNPGLEPGRVDVIVGGAVVLVALMRHLEFDECLVSEADILDGLVLSLLD